MSIPIYGMGNQCVHLLLHGEPYVFTKILLLTGLTQSHMCAHALTKIASFPSSFISGSSNFPPFYLLGRSRCLIHSHLFMLTVSHTHIYN